MSDLIKWEPGSLALPEEVAAKLAEQSAENLTGVQARLPKIQLPTGKGKQFAVSVPGEDEIQVNEIIGVVLYQTPANAYWKEKFGGGGTAVIPDCASHDGIRPSSQYPDVQNDSCINCRHNRFGSAVGDQGQKLRGKACRNVKRVVVLDPTDTAMPKLMTVPPGSLRAFDDYLIGLRKHKRPYWSIVTSFTIKTESSSGNIDFPMIVPAIKGFINSPESLVSIEQLRAEWTKILSQFIFTTDETGPTEDTYTPQQSPPENAADPTTIPF